MALNALGLGIVLECRDMAAATMAKVRGEFQKLDTVSADTVKNFEKNVVRFKAGIGLLGIGVGILGAAFEISGPAAKFEQSMADLQSISGATAVELEMLKRAALDAGIATQFSPLEAAHALRELAAQGYSAKESIDLLKPSLDLAAASLGELGVADAAQLTAQTLKAFGIEAGSAKLAVDQLLQSANLFALAPKDLPLAVGIGARGAQLMHQTLDETLIALGLVKNIIPTVERSSTAVAVAMERMAAPTKREMKYLDELGLKAYDAKGKFKPFLDVIDDLNKRISGKTDAQKALLLNRIFGAEGGAGAQAILTQLNNGIRTATGEMLTGAKAIAYLRDQMSSADGVAKAFADRRLNTLEGQKTLLHGSMETLAIAIGDPIAKAFKPIVAGVINVVNKIITTMTSIPASTKEAFVKVVLAVGAIVTALGGILAVGSGLSMISAILGVLGITVGGIAFALAPLLLGLAAAGLLFAAFNENMKTSQDGMEGFFGPLAKIGLLFDALVQVFSTGKFSGEVNKELKKAGNQGVMDFAVSVYVWANRIINWWDHMVDSFKAASEELSPIFATMKDLLHLLVAQFDVVAGSVDDNQKAFDLAGDSGDSFGRDLVKLAGIVGHTLNGVLMITVGLAWLLKETFRELGEFFTAIGKGMIWMARQISDAFVILADTWYAFVKPFAATADMIGKVVGKKWNLEARVLAEQADVHKTMHVRTWEERDADENDARTSRLAKKAYDTDPSAMWSAADGSTEGNRSKVTEKQASEIMAERYADQVRAMGSHQPTVQQVMAPDSPGSKNYVIHNYIMMDGKRIGESVMQSVDAQKRDETARSFMTPVEEP